MAAIPTPIPSPPPTLQDLENTFGNAVQVILGLSGIVLFIMFITAGFKFITAGGDPKAMESAKHTLTYAVIGIVVIALSYLILNLIGSFTGATNVTIFKIYQQ